MNSGKLKEEMDQRLGLYIYRREMSVEAVEIRVRRGEIQQLRVDMLREERLECPVKKLGVGKVSCVKI